jgi:paraquat-inducible protein B
LGELEKSLASAGPDGNVQGDLLRTLDELRGAIRSIEAMSDTIKEKPNSLLFGKEDSGNPKPKAAGKR